MTRSTSLSAFLITCEHGGKRIPEAYQGLFRGRDRLLNSHLGFDSGALAMARSLAAALGAPLEASTVSRLLIDLNRPIGHPQLFSAVMRKATVEVRAAVIRRYHEPYLARVEGLVRRAIESGGRVIHISSHSFTGELNGKLRQADIGLLYDPGRTEEADLCARWKDRLVEVMPDLRVRRNYPYQGRSAGLTALLRRKFTADTYVGIELEINQNIVLGAGRIWNELLSVVPQTLCLASGDL